MIGGRYMATKIDALASTQLTRTSGLSSLFNRQISAIAKPTDAHKPIRATGATSPVKNPISAE